MKKVSASECRSVVMIAALRRRELRKVNNNKIFSSLATFATEKFKIIISSAKLEMLTHVEA